MGTGVRDGLRGGSGEGGVGEGGVGGREGGKKGRRVLNVVFVCVCFFTAIC